MTMAGCWRIPQRGSWYPPVFRSYFACLGPLLLWAAQCRSLYLPMPLGFQPMPFGYSLRGHCRTERRKEWVPRFVATRPIVLPLLWGEGWGEGERGRRTVAAAQYVFGTRATEPQILAALVCAFCAASERWTGGSPSLPLEERVGERRPPLRFGAAFQWVTPS